MNTGEFGSDRKCSPHVGGVSAARSKMGRRRGVCERIAAPSGNGNGMPEPEGKHFEDDDIRISVLKSWVTT